MLKGILKDREFISNDEIDEVIASTWNGLTFDDAQNVFRKWMIRLACVIKNGGDCPFDRIRNNCLMFNECENGGAPRACVSPSMRALSCA
jgi:hypothetical protein